MIWRGKYVCFPLFSSAKVEISPEIRIEGGYMEGLGLLLSFCKTMWLS